MQSPKASCAAVAAIQQSPTKRMMLALLPVCAIALTCGFALGNWYASSTGGVLLGARQGWPQPSRASSDSLRSGLGHSLKAVDVRLSTGTRQLYYVARSTVPGAGLGIFAAEDLPRGTIWNPEDASPENTVVFSRAQWQTLLTTIATVEAAGFNSTGYHRLLSLLNTYMYYNLERDQMVLVLTPSGFTNHGPEPRAGRAGQGGDAQDLPTANSGFSNDPSGLLSATLRDVKRGEEILEDYRTYNNPWPRGAEGAHAYDKILS